MARDYLNRAERDQLLALFVADEMISKACGEITKPIAHCPGEDRQEWAAREIKPIRDKARKIAREVES